jgi:Sulfotransferase domain
VQRLVTRRISGTTIDEDMSATKGKQLRRLPSTYRVKRATSVVAPRSVAQTVGRRVRGERLVVVLGSAHRVGSTWLTQMLEDLIGFEYEFEYRRVPKACRGYSTTIALEAPETRDFLERARGFRFFKTHSLLDWEEIPPHVKFVSVYRDPRDMLVSTAFHMAAMSEEEGGFPPELTGLSVRDQLLHLMDVDYFLGRLEHWFRHPLVCQVGYEELKADGAAGLRRVIDHLGLDISDAQIRETVGWHNFERRSGRKPGEADARSGMRKGVVGDWENHFDEECREHFKVALDGRWNALLLEMGYVWDLRQHGG